MPNGSGLFWRVEKDGVAPSWLFGTMHVPDEGVTKLRAPVAAAFAGASTLVVESTEVLATPDFASLQRHVAKLPRNIDKAQMESVEKRLAALASRSGPAAPKGPMPKGAQQMKGMQRAARRR